MKEQKFLLNCIKRTERISKTHRIENTGRHAKYGKGYLWNNTLATVSPYDKVEWKWNIATSGSSPGINIFEVESAAATIYNEKGIYTLIIMELHSVGIYDVSNISLSFHRLFFWRPKFNRGVLSNICWFGNKLLHIGECN